MNKEFSAFTQELFGDVEIAGHPVLELLQLSTEQDTEKFSRMSFWLSNIVGADELQWMMSEAEGVVVDQRGPVAPVPCHLAPPACRAERTGGSGEGSGGGKSGDPGGQVCNRRTNAPAATRD